MSAELMIRRAQTMVLWYRDLPEFATSKTDREIAVELHRASPNEGWVDPHSREPGNYMLVRRVRRWIDQQRGGEFAGYSFGTKRAGRGVTWSHMNTPESRLMSATIGTASQVLASETAARADAERRGREAMKFNVEAEEWFQLGDFQRSMACRDAANDIEQTGMFRPSTRQAMVRLGILQ